jgi:hypothetical protein
VPRRSPKRGGTEPFRERRDLLGLAAVYDQLYGSSPWARAEGRLKRRLGRRRVRHLTRAELVWLGDWKTPRIRPQVARNTERRVRGVTATAFRTRDERRRIQLLCELPGVGLAVASVILHFVWPNRYPVWDIRVRTALRRLGVRRRFPPTPSGWLAYAACLRELARRRRVSLRTLDKALWWLGGPTPRRRDCSPLQRRRSEAILG